MWTCANENLGVQHQSYSGALAEANQQHRPRPLDHDQWTTDQSRRFSVLTVNERTRDDRMPVVSSLPWPLPQLLHPCSGETLSRSSESSGCQDLNRVWSIPRIAQILKPVPRSKWMLGTGAPVQMSSANLVFRTVGYTCRKPDF